MALKTFAVNLRSHIAVDHNITSGTIKIRNRFLKIVWGSSPNYALSTNILLGTSQSNAAVLLPKYRFYFKNCFRRTKSDDGEKVKRQEEKL